MPKAGDIFASFNQRLEAFVAFQLTPRESGGSWPVLTLDWSGPALPTKSEINAMRPAEFTYPTLLKRPAPYQHVVAWSGAMPRSYQHVGWREPMILDAPRMFSRWPDGTAIVHQRAWDAHDSKMMQAYLACQQEPDQTVLLQGEEWAVTRSAKRVDSQALSIAESFEVFDQLPMLEFIRITQSHDGLFRWLRTRSLITRMQISGQKDPVLDLRGTHLRNLELDVAGLKDVRLNSSLEHLTITGTCDPSLVISCECNGRNLIVNATDPTLTWEGLPELGGLELWEVDGFDPDLVVARFPELTALAVAGRICRTSTLLPLGRLSRLQFLSLTEVFPEQAEFPSPACWPQLTLLRLHSVPDAIAKAVKKSFKSLAPDELDLDVRRPRKPEWLAANMDNPFRDWEGRSGISTSQAKKAATLYRNARSSALDRATQLAGQPAALTETLTQIATNYIDGFNAMDRRAQIIETVEREEILDALATVIGAVESVRQTQLGADVVPLDRRPILVSVEALREF
ncbi:MULTISPECIES: hypothetical protein [Stenotrophomonas]|uniref:Gliding motility protein n=1 Tax=Stenotrophomonas lactitubi TaxID=2045214 RepID=A0AAW4GJ64_9GAMM|nr:MULTISPECIES: hypothetical protein [Stenotrophomonas]MBM9914483.1 hypothetical protein [Stenotrophomonas lactitubi]MBM9921617.1 hypothetical protein [Stenotrophomonas lactitubi]MBM9938724.1 hypothetical protein [Stenotrophomonas lactitubi]